MRVLLVPNALNPLAVSASVELVAWLSAQGIQPLMAAADATAVSMPDIAAAPEALDEVVLAVALGGDGTILKAFHHLDDRQIPLLGVKFGRLGFLSGATADNMRESVMEALSGDVRIERRATLKADVYMEGRVAGSYRAMNEVVLSRGASTRVIAFDITIDDHRVASLRADGVVVASATGSTAYALSAGGPIVSPDFGGLVVVPVAPHTLLARALVTGSAEAVEVKLSDPARSDACVVVDGDVAPCRRQIERILVRRSEHDVSLVKLHGRDFYETVAEEFFGG